MLDAGVATKMLATHCPQMPVYRNEDDLHHRLPQAGTVLSLAHSDYGNNKSEWNDWQLTRMETWAGDLLHDVTDKAGHAPSLQHPVLVDIGGPMLSFRLDHEPHAFQTALGHVISFGEPIYKVAGEILYELHQRLQKLGIKSSTDSPSEINTRGFMGAHLRTAQDVTDLHWLDYNSQTEAYIAEALRRNLTLIYVSSGSPKDIIRFREEASAHGLIIVSRNDLLSDADVESIPKLSWDQLALIDYTVLLRSAFFMGIDSSTFALNIAMTRRGNKQSGVQSVEIGQGVLSADPDRTISDELSWCIRSPWSLGWLINSMWP